MKRFRRKGIAIGLSLSLLASMPMMAYADGVDPSTMTREQIVAEYNRLKDLEAGDSLDAFVHSLSEEQRRELLAAVIMDAVEEGIEEAETEIAEKENHTSWKLDENGVLIISGSGSMLDFSKPESAPWHAKRDQITAVAVELGVTRIGNFAFADCPNLSEISLPASVKEIGWNAFQNGVSLKKLDLPEGLEMIEGNAFDGCTGLQKVTVPEGVTAVGFGAFQKCDGLISISLPSTLEKLGEGAFADCRGLKSVSLPENLKELGAGAFLNCEALQSMTIPNGVTEIANNLFNGCKLLNYVKMHENIQSIGEGAFIDCVTMHKASFPKNLTVIGDRAFAGCISLTKLVLPDSLTKLGEEAFAGCSNLESVKVNDGLQEIGTDCFRGCIHLADLNLPETTAETVPEETEEATVLETAAEETSPEEDASFEETAESVPVGESEEAAEESTEVSLVPAILVENITASAGNTVTLTISLQDNPGIVSLALNVKFDETVMKLVKAEDTGMISGGEHKQMLTSPYRLNWANDTMMTNITENGCIAVLTFEISEEARKGAYPVSVEYDLENGDIYNSELEAIPFEVQNGVITVVNAARGDVNGDGVINGLDRAALNRYLTMGREALQDIDLAAADVNSDGKVNNVDRAILSRYLAGWEGYESLGGEAE